MVAGATLVFVEGLPGQCEKVIYQNETLYLCDGVLYRATYYDDELVYEIVSTAGDEGAADTGGTLRLTSPYMRGERVRVLQQALESEGYSVGGVDGVFGRATERALRSFQRDAGLEQNGSLDGATQRALGI